MAGLWGQRLVSTISWRRFGGLQKVTGRFCEEVLGGWIQGENVKAFPKDPFKSVEARIISNGEGKMMGVTGGAGGWCWSDGELGDSCFWIRGQVSHGRRRPWLGYKYRCVGLRDESRYVAPGGRGLGDTVFSRYGYCRHC